jgi:hypothetical protein
MGLTQKRNSWQLGTAGLHSVDPRVQGGPMRPAETEDFRFVAYMLRWLEEVEAQGKAKERIRVS